MRRPDRLVHDTLLSAAKAAGDTPAVVAGDRRIDYATFATLALRLGRAFQECGLERGDRVALFVENGWPAAVAIYATWLAGGVVSVINPQTKSEKLAYILQDSGARIALVDAALAPTFNQAVTRPHDLRAAFIVGPCDASAPGLPRIPLDAALAEDASPKPVRTIPVDLAALIYTSGSTGQPKGVMMAHQNIRFTTDSLVEYLRLGAEDRILNVLPLAFDYGLYQLLMSVRLGGLIALERSFAFPAHVVRRTTDEGITVFPGVPTIFATLLALHRSTGTVLPTVRRVTNTAAALPPEWNAELQRVFPSALLFRMYGLTECKRVCYLEPEELQKRPTSVGRAIPGTEVFLLGADGQPVEPGAPGILHVRGPHIMLGYWKQPELTRRMIKPGAYEGDRVLCSHDVFTTDEEGYLYFVARTDEIIKTRGEKVSPVEVESALYAIPGVLEAAVIGVSDPLLGEGIYAFIAADPSASLTEQTVKRACHARLESFMVPSRVIFRDALPKTGTGKLQKQDLLNLIQEEVSDESNRTRAT
jgi:acyl-CoA synthetase (AMP-forming)/AMP-acid ligase II